MDAAIRFSFSLSGAKQNRRKRQAFFCGFVTGIKSEKNRMNENHLIGRVESV
ncbi:MAG: hypothetical protein Q8P67_28960 [archaeon]|nr:hypothetical protein [archaeon]